MRGVMWLLLLSWSSLSLATSLLGGRAGQQIHPNRHRHHQHDIYIAGFFPTTPGRPGSAVGQGVMPAVKLALHDVNRSPDILPNHHLRMHWNNTAVRKSALCHGLAQYQHFLPDLIDGKIVTVTVTVQAPGHVKNSFLIDCWLIAALSLTAII